ncbi:MAG: cation-translocating P-type ATPase [Candidatus Binatia bacterium]
MFARILPGTEARFVETLIAGGDIVAMTGDGVNDAPALKAAHIGIAMGKRGTDVAREAASLVLLDDEFLSIVEAVRMGRRIYGNLERAMAYLLAVHVPVAGVALVPLLLGWPLLLLPVHIAFLELIIDPACSVAFEAEPAESDVMSRPPRDVRRPLFTRRLVLVALLTGASVLGVVLTVFAVAWLRGQGATEARTLGFATLVIANVALILVHRSSSSVVVATLRRPNRALWWVCGGALAVLALLLYVPTLRDLFQFSLLHADDVALCLVAGCMSVIGVELSKLGARARA